MIAKLWKYQKLPILLTILSLILYWVFAYDLERSDYTKLILLYSGLFVSFYIIVQRGKADFWFLAALAILFRVIFLYAIPNLSQDFYRFIWDGRLLIQSINPYVSTPQSFMEAGNISVVAQSQELYEGMGTLNGSHFTNYPPINQLCFAIAGLFYGKSILGSAIVFRILIILADIGVIIVGKKLLQKMELPIHHIFWYVLNPFIIIEMTGNLHFESVMLFFVIWALYLLSIKKWFWSAVILGTAVSVKLIPLLFLPLFFQYFMSNAGKGPWLRFRTSSKLRINFSVKNISRLSLFYSVVIGTVVLTFLPFLSGTLAENFGASIALWFQKFEFNASVYYLIRWYGYQTIGWNIIGDVGPVLPRIVIGFIVLITFLRKNSTLKELITVMVFSICFYFMLSTTVHPWYIATPLILCVFTRYRFPLVWSGTVMLSYAAYGANGFAENLWLVAIEYSIVLGFFIWEVFSHKSKKHKLHFQESLDS